jgi:hypothetical protein
MAGFAIDIGDEGTAYAQGVTMPSATGLGAAAEGLSMLGKGVFRTLDAMDAAKRAAQPSESAINREAFSALSKSLDGTKGASPLQARTLVNQAITEYNNLGFDIGEAEARMIKQRTGIDVDFVNFNPQQAAIDATIEKLQANPAYLYNARVTLDKSGKPYSNEDVLSQAMSDVQRSEASALYLVNAKNITRQEFHETYVPNANVALENVRSLALAGLAIETEGGNIKPENIVQLRTQFDVVKAQFTKPPLIETGDWQVIQSQIDTLDQLLTTLEKYDENTLSATKAEILEPITKSLMLQAKELGQTDPILAAALLSDKVDWSAYVSGRYPEILKTLDSIEAEDTVYTDLFAAPQDDITIIEGEIPPEPTIDTLHDGDEVEKATERGNQARLDSISFAAIERIGVMNPTMMDQPEHRTNFLTGVGQATVNISTSPTLFKTETMNLVYNDDTYSKLALIRNLDPDKAEIASKRLIDALQAQFNIASTTMSGAMQSSYFKITGLGKIEYDLDARVDTGQIRMDRAVLPLVKTSASKYYNGDVTAMLADRGRRVPTFERSQIENAGFKFNTAYQDYRKVQKNARSLDFYISNMKKLGVDTATIESLMVQPTVIGEPTGDLGTRTNPFQIFWSDETDTDERLFASIDDGQYFIGPDGKTYVKGMD